jgi:hypothetical protein
LPLVPVMKSNDFRKFNHGSKLGRLNGHGECLAHRLGRRDLRNS